jgi:hypothetical protein
MEVLMALLMIGVGAFMIFFGVMCGVEVTATYGAEAVVMGFMSFLCIISGLMCFAMLKEL